jgi:hypothetical protein
VLQLLQQTRGLQVGIKHIFLQYFAIFTSFLVLLNSRKGLHELSALSR